MYYGGKYHPRNPPFFPEIASRKRRPYGKIAVSETRGKPHAYFETLRAQEVGLR